MKITRSQIRRIVRESLLVEGEMLKIMDNAYEDLSVFNRIANYALTDDIAGAMADPEVNTDELYWEIDEMRPWVNRVGDEDDHWFADDVVVPDNWDAEVVYEFMEDLENAWHEDQAKKDHAAVAADPDKDWLEFMANEFATVIVPNDLRDHWAGKSIRDIFVYLHPVQFLMQWERFILQMTILVLDTHLELEKNLQSF